MCTAFLLVGLAAGALLGLVFRVFVLVPASLVTALLVVGVSMWQHHEFLLALFEALATVTLLQIGYFAAGLVSREVESLSRRLGKFFAHHHSGRQPARRS